MERNKPILMIHEVYDWMLELDLSNYIITFDDGLYSQYKNLKHFFKFDTPKYFFISTNIVNPIKSSQVQEVVECQIAHKNFFKNGETSPYMNWDQIIEISNTNQCYIGGHSHFHRDLRGEIKIKELHEHLKQDTDKMFQVFNEKKLEIDSFCFPYNYEAPLYREILKQRGIKNFFGKERIGIEDIRKK